VLNTPVDRIRCSLVGKLRVPARVSSLSVLPSPFGGRVGVHVVTFEACSSFTRVTACKVAHPPYVGFIARLRPSRLPGSGARKLSSSTNNLLEWVLPPLVIYAVEAHPQTPPIGIQSRLNAAVDGSRQIPQADPAAGSRRRHARTHRRCRLLRVASGPYRIIARFANKMNSVTRQQRWPLALSLPLTLCCHGKCP
jgi:hypothetical protein